MVEIISDGIWLIWPWYLWIVENLLSPVVWNVLLMIFLINLLSVEVLSRCWQSRLIKWVNLCLRFDFLIVWKVIGRCKLSLLKVIKGQTMTKQYISLFAFRMGKDKIFVLDLLKFFNLRLDYGIGSIRIDWFGGDICFQPCSQILIFVLVLNYKLIFGFCNLTCQYVWNLIVETFAGLILFTSKFVW